MTADGVIGRPDLLVNILECDDLTAFSLAMTLMCYIVYKLAISLSTQDNLSAL